MIDMQLEQPQPITGDLKNFQMVLDQMNREFQRLQRNIEAVKNKAQEST